MKKLLSLVLAVVMMLGCVAFTAVAEGALTDGVYTQTTAGFGGDVTVTITVSGGTIIEVAIEGNSETPAIGGQAISAMSEQIIVAQSSDVDGVSGATVTSSAIKLAAELALNEAAGTAAAANQYVPGTYTAIVAGHNADFEIYVTFTEDAIVGVEMGENVENHGIGDRAVAELSAQIIANQTLNVDALAGATVTSKAFLAGMADAVTAAGGSVAALQTPAPKAEVATEDTTCDIVVVGGGGAGLAATVEAAQQGKNVILVEQLGILGGASGRAGYIMAAGTAVHEANGVDFSVDALLGAYGITNEDTVRFENQTSADVNWLVDIGVEFGPVNLMTQLYGPNGARLGGFYTEGMHAYMDANGVDYRLNTRADHLLTNEAGDVIGVCVENPDGVYYNIYCDAVILATGGYFANAEMTEYYFPGFGSNPFDCGIGADGSGMLMAEAVGAELSTMDYANFHAIAGFHSGASRSLTLVAGNGGLAVNGSAQRFFNEAGDYTAFTAAAKQQDRVVAIFDATIADLDVVKNDVGCAATWGMYTVCNTVEELAAAMGLDADALNATLESYRASIAAGVDEFGKTAAYMRSDMTTAPYYAVDTLVENHTTYGGISTDDDTRVLNANGEVIKGLYAAGECTHKKSYMLGNFGACIYEGRLAVATSEADK